LAEKKSTSPETKKTVLKKVTEDPVVEKKVATVKKVSKTDVPIVEKKPDRPVTLTKQKVAPEKKVSKAKVSPIKEGKLSELEAPTVEKQVLKNKVESIVPKPKPKNWTGNPMRMPKIEKVTVNMSVGKSGGPLQQAVTILKQLTDQEPSRRAAKKTIREFGIRKGESIACLVTIRDEKAQAFLRKAFYALENKLSKYNFDRQGNFSFGIKEHIDIPGTKYAPELGIHGMDVSVSLGRPGFRVKRRHRSRTKIGKDHQLTADEAILFIKDEFDVEIT
jgi:large subunit ribosomal protein L5